MLGRWYYTIVSKAKATDRDEGAWKGVRTSLICSFFVREAVARSSDDGWNARDVIGVVRCSSDLRGSGCMSSDLGASDEDE